MEDNLGDVRLFEEAFSDVTSRRFDIEAVPLLGEAMRRAQKEAFDLVVLDLSLPDSSGIATFETMRRAVPSTPIVVLTGQDDGQLGLTVVNGGAQDYLVKGVSGGPAMIRALLFAIARNRCRAAQQGQRAVLADAQRPGRHGAQRHAPTHGSGSRTFRQLADTISEVYFIVDATFQHTYFVNHAYEGVWGQSCTSLYEDASSFFKPVSGEDRARFMGYIASVTAGEAPDPLEFELRPQGGNARWVAAHLTPVRNEWGEIYRFSGFALDITERRQAREALRASELRLFTLFETVNLVVLLLDANGNVEYLNPFGLQLTGYFQDEALGKNWLSQFLPAAFVHDAPLGRERERVRVPLVTRAGEPRVISWSTTVFRDGEGNQTGSLSVGEDVTEFELLEEHGRQSRRLEAVGRLAAGVAHDFNNLLTIIMGSADLLRGAIAPGSGLLDDLEPITNAASAAAALTRQLLVFGRQDAAPSDVTHLEDVVERTVTLLRRVVNEDVAIQVTLHHHPCTVMVTASQLEQVIMNLAVNARDAMPDGGRLTIKTDVVTLDANYASAHWPATPGSYAVLSMSDTGIGMDDVTRARIFEPFFTTKAAGMGTGLGLATAYGIVKQRGGFIRVNSLLGKGTMFKVYLPLSSGSPAPLAEHQVLSVTPRGTETVLLVEDAAAVRSVVRQSLVRCGYSVLEASNGREALELAATRNGPIDLLLTDVVMPEMNGKELVDQFTLIQPNARLLYMSGHTDDAVLRHGVLSSGIAYIQKPFTPDALARRVRETIDAQPLPRENS
ncbi:MAG: response regulator [bacterium]